MIRDWNKAKEQGEADPNAWYQPLSEELDTSASRPIASSFRQLESAGYNDPGLDKALSDDTASDVTAKVAAPEADTTIADAREADKRSALMRAIELGSKQAISGLTGTQVGALGSQPTNYEATAIRNADIKSQRDTARAIDTRNFAEKQKMDLMAADKAAREAKRQSEQDKYKAEQDKVEQDLRRQGLSAQEAHYRATEGLQRQQIAATLAGKESASAEKKAEGESEREVYGLNGERVVAKTKKEGEDLRKATSEAKTMLGTIDEITSDLTKEGLAMNPWSERTAKLEALARDLQLNAKGTAMYQLGVLSGPDLRLLEQITGEVKSINPLNVYGVGAKPTIAKMQVLADNIKRKHANALQSQGKPSQSSVHTMKLPSGEVVEVE